METPRSLSNPLHSLFPLVSLLLAGLTAIFPTPVTAWTWDGAEWADYSAFLGPVDAEMKEHLRKITWIGKENGRVEGRLGQIGDSITQNPAYFRNTVLFGTTDDETGHDYAPIRSWLSYSGLQPADENSFYRDHGKGADYGNHGGWRIAFAVSAGHPDRGVVIGDGVVPGEYSWALVMFGTNDIDWDWDVATWKEDLRRFVREYTAIGVVPVLSTIPPEVRHQDDGRVEAANQAILGVAWEERIPWVDFHGLILHHQPTNWHGTLIDEGGTHPSSTTDGRGFSEIAQTTTDGYALRTKLTLDMAEKLKALVWDDGSSDSMVGAPMELLPPVAVLRAFPNPFRTSTTLVGSGATALRILDVTGRRVRTLPAGPSPTIWDGMDEAGRTVPAGTYWVTKLGSESGWATRIVRLH